MGPLVGNRVGFILDFRQLYKKHSRKLLHLQDSVVMDEPEHRLKQLPEPVHILVTCLRSVNKKCGKVTLLRVVAKWVDFQLSKTQ